MDDAIQVQAENIPEPLDGPVTEKISPAGKLFAEACSIFSKSFLPIMTIFAAPFLLLSASVFVNKSAILQLALIVGASIVSYTASLVFVHYLGNGVVSLRTALRYFFPTFWVSLLNLFALLGLVLAFAAVIVGLGASGVMNGVVPALLLAVASLVGIIFLVVLAVSLSFAYLACNVDDRRGLNASALSMYYVKGTIKSVLWRMIFMGLVVSLSSMVLGMILSFAGLVTENTQQTYLGIVEDAKFQEDMVLSPIGATISTVFQVFVFGPISVIYSYLLYGALKRRKQAPTDDDMKLMRNRLKMLVWLAPIAMVALVAVIASWGLGEVINNAIQNAPLKNVPGASSVIDIVR